MTQSVKLRFNNHHRRSVFEISVSVEEIDNYELIIMNVLCFLNSECPIYGGTFDSSNCIMKWKFSS